MVIGWTWPFHVESLMQRKQSLQEAIVDPMVCLGIETIRHWEDGLKVLITLIQDANSLSDEAQGLGQIT